jgi:hypothetical protein
MQLLDLPYDIRHQIYLHLFPTGQQIYIQANRDRLRSITADREIPTGLLRTCKSLGKETLEFLYSNYLFNIVGRKKNCLSSYDAFVEVVEKYARDEVYYQAFSNGSHSDTMCVSVHAGEHKIAILDRRQRGEPKTIVELQHEVGSTTRASAWPSVLVRIRPSPGQRILTATICIAISAIILAFVLRPIDP